MRIKVTVFLGKKNVGNSNTMISPMTPRSIFTLRGRLGFRNTIMSGIVISTAILVEETIVAVTTTGIDFINSPMIPVDNRSGKNAQMVVMVVDHSGTIKSFQTRMPVSAGVNLPVA